MEYEEFATMVREAGLTARDCGNGHYRIEGGRYEVNWHPFSKRSTIYINGLKGSRSSRDGGAKEAIEAANQEPTIKRSSSDKAKRKKTYRGIKLMLLKKSPSCYWCKMELNKETATVDHKISLGRGGSNGTDNLVLACEKCNQTKGNNIWHKDKK